VSVESINSSATRTHGCLYRGGHDAQLTSRETTTRLAQMNVAKTIFAYPVWCIYARGVRLVGEAECGKRATFRTSTQGFASAHRHTSMRPACTRKDPSSASGVLTKGSSRTEPELSWYDIIAIPAPPMGDYYFAAHRNDLFHTSVST
jgi:hypothetical protein